MKKRRMKIWFSKQTKKDPFGFAQGFNGGRKRLLKQIFKKNILVEDTESFREFVWIDRNHFQFLVKKL